MTKYRRADPEISRRKFINVALGTAGVVGGLGLVTALAGVRPPIRITAGKLPALEGDVLVYADGTDAGKPVKVAALTNKPTRVWPQGKDKAGNVVIRKDEPNNLLLLFKFEESELVEPTDIAATQGGVVAYTGICMHLGCQVGENTAKGKEETLLCPCHSGAYDPRAGAEVVGGPPPRPLSQLPIRLDGETVVAKGPLLHPYYGVTESAWASKLKEAETL